MRGVFAGAAYFNLVRRFSLAWFKGKDQSSFFGVLWSFFKPLIFSATLYFLFRTRFHTGKESFFYILIGLMAWDFFSSALAAGMSALQMRPDMVRNLVFPKETLVFGQVLVRLFQHLLELVVILSVLLFFGQGLSWHLVFLPLVIVSEVLFIMGLALLLCCLYAYVRDTSYIFGFFTYVVFFCVPVFYDASILSPWARKIVYANPVTYMLGFYRDVFLYHRMPDLHYLTGLTVLGAVLCALAYRIFKSHEWRIAEIV